MTGPTPLLLMVRAIFPGQFNPIHNGDVEIARRAASLFDELIIAVSARPNPRELFTFTERVALVRGSFWGEPPIRIVGFQELSFEFCRSMRAQVIVSALSVFSDFDREFRRSLMLDRLRPEVEIVVLNTSSVNQPISAALVREIAALGGDVTSMVPPHVARALQAHFSPGCPGASGS